MSKVVSTSNRFLIYKNSKKVKYEIKQNFSNKNNKFSNCYKIVLIENNKEYTKERIKKKHLSRKYRHFSRNVDF